MIYLKLVEIWSNGIDLYRSISPAGGGQGVDLHTTHKHQPK